MDNSQGLNCFSLQLCAWGVDIFFKGKFYFFIYLSKEYTAFPTIYELSVVNFRPILLFSSWWVRYFKSTGLTLFNFIIFFSSYNATPSRLNFYILLPIGMKCYEWSSYISYILSLDNISSGHIFSVTVHHTAFVWEAMTLPTIEWVLYSLNVFSFGAMLILLLFSLPLFW